MPTVYSDGALAGCCPPGSPHAFDITGTGQDRYDLFQIFDRNLLTTGYLADFVHLSGWRANSSIMRRAYRPLVEIFIENAPPTILICLV